MAEPLKLPERELQSSSEECRELPVDVDGLEDSGTLPRRKGLSKVVEEPDADTRVVLNGKCMYMHLLVLLSGCGLISLYLEACQ